MTSHDEAAAHALRQLTASFYGDQPVRRPTAEKMLGPNVVGTLLRADLAALELDPDAPMLLSPDPSVRKQARALHDERARLHAATRDRLAREKAAEDSEERELADLMAAYEYDQETERLAAGDPDEHLSIEELTAEVEAEFAAEDRLPGEEAGDEWGYGSW